MGITGRAAILSACLAVNSAAMAQDFKVTLLGTGVPFPIPDRFGAATLVEAGKERLLFDVGRGATIRLNQIGVSMGTLNAVFHVGHPRPMAHGLDRPLLRQQAEPVPRHRTERHRVADAKPRTRLRR